MKTIKETLRAHWLIGLLTVLSVGVLVGCEYCGPLLLATVAGATVYGFTRLVNDVLQANSINHSTF